ncbi:MAG: TonB family protein [Candidatus Omnitrophica bacterium]|nr:TonB family protein [Candidatus Omnitrophota bacterium]
MRIKRIMLLYLFAILTVIAIHPTVSFSYSPSNEPIVQYIIDLSRDINNSIQKPEGSALYDSSGEVRLKLLLSPWGELKDAYISESSGNKDLDRTSLKAVWLYERYQPFPEELGEKDLWLDVPIIFEMPDMERYETAVGEEWFILDKTGEDIRISGMEDAIDIALENHTATKIAEEEVALSRLKISEARRALYPAASLNYIETTGKTTGSTQDFTDEEYKVKFEYPLYYGWRLKYAVEQAIANMEASRHNYDKVLEDLRGEVETAFYSYLATKINERLQHSLLKDTEEVFDIAKKRFDLGLSTKAEFLQVESQMRQITYQVTSSENDLALAELTLAQAMNVEDTGKLKDVIDIDIDMMDLGPIDIGVELEECVELAFKNRPDLKAREHMVQFNEYEQKIAKSRDQLKVDLTGSYGRSGGAYESETMELGTDWYVGLKVSKPIGGNTLSTSYTEDKTSEKHGQSSRTESTSTAVELGLLDNLQSLSEKKTASIALKKARQELEQTKEGIFKEVNESYLNYKKGILQANASFNKMRYREEELKITKARSDLNEIPYSELIQAHMNLTDEKSYYIEAIGSLYQSLVRLNKATGYALFLDSESFMLANAR